MMGAIKREGKRILLSAIHKAQAKVERARVTAELGRYSTEVIKNEKPQKKKSVLFLVTRMVRFHGGQTSLLRLGTKLSEMGFEVGYAVYKPQDRREMERCAKSNLADFRGMLFTVKELDGMLSGKKRCADIVVASSWDTVSFAKKLPGYKMYFVQDYEPYFYPFGERFLLARKTYEQGLHMVSLGAWNKRMIKRECHPVSPIDVIDFPYEAAEYPYRERDFLSYREKKTLRLAVYLKYYGKRLPCIIPELLLQLKDLLAGEGITLLVEYFGEAKSFSAPGGKNLGMLDKEGLRKLYDRADFGMVASLSNISLVPYEMLSAGLPVIEFEDGTFAEFFPEGSATLTGLSAQELCQKILALLQEPTQLSLQLKRAHNYMDGLGWEKSAAQFAGIIRGL
ncbi:MAG: glycosyltransferase family 1 protein [Lachnospiraceae bacterium]|nr:glycosyltransferase family 1 protein [Lachnospiraceae bacterium]